MIENYKILDDEKNLLYAPLLSKGIQTVEWFIEQFFSKKDRNILFSKFKNTHIEKTIFTPKGVEKLNKYTIDSQYKYWDSLSFYKEVNKFETDYKGIHPIRVSDTIQSLMLDMTLKTSLDYLKK
tara:strand:- start:540 stop:911 length:372 start_codon:yes stop_codon:yes gene_type:complete